MIACLFYYLDRRTTTRADGRRSIDHERHVARTVLLAAFCRDGSGNVGGRDQTPGHQQRAIGENNFFEVPWSGGVRSHHPCTAIEKPQDATGRSGTSNL